MTVPVAVQAERRRLPASLYSLLVHLLFLGVLTFSLAWQNRAPDAVQAELWSALPAPAQIAAPAPAPESPAPEPPAPEPPAPELPAPEPLPIEAAAPIPPPVEAEAPPPAKPDIVVEKTPKPVERKPPVPEPPQKDTLAKAEADLKKLDREIRSKAPAQQKQDQAEEQRLNRLLQNSEALRRQDAAGRKLDALDAATNRITAKIRSLIIAPSTVPDGVKATLHITVLPDGSVLESSIRLVQSSGQPAWDEAVQHAVLQAQPLPMPEDPDLKRKLRDLILVIKSGP